MYHAIARRWTPDYQKKAEAIRMTDDKALDEMLHVALENAIGCEVTSQPERGLYWLRCAMLAQSRRTCATPANSIRKATDFSR